MAWPRRPRREVRRCHSGSLESFPENDLIAPAHGSAPIDSSVKSVHRRLCAFFDPGNGGLRGTLDPLFQELGLFTRRGLQDEIAQLRIRAFLGDANSESRD